MSGKTQIVISAAIWAVGGSTVFGAEVSALVLAQSIELSDVQGRIGHLAVDVAARRLFVAATENNTVEIIDLPAGKRTESIKDVRAPLGIAYRDEDGTLFVGATGGNSCEIIDGGSLQPLSSLPLGRDIEKLLYFSESRCVYVGYGRGIGVIDAVRRTRIADIPLKGHPHSFQLEANGKRMFVNVPRASHVAVIDRLRNSVIATWPIRNSYDNYAMALDESHRRLYLGCRNPPSLVAVEIANGRLVSSVRCGGDVDDVFYDYEARRIYASCGEGFVEVFDGVQNDKLRRIQRVETAAGARTSLFVPELRSLFVPVPRRGSQNAEIRVYRVNR